MTIENEKIDIKENNIIKIDENILKILLKDNTSGVNIIWASDNYVDKGIDYNFHSQIQIRQVTGNNGEMIKPRIKKTIEERKERIKKKAEVFTPAWVCNIQNNMVDDKWFGYNNVFNITIGKKWIPKKEKIVFENSKSWKEYVTSKRLEISCGEAPYLVSRYDAVTGKIIKIDDRIGLLDRKLRIIKEANLSDNEWLYWTIKAYQSVYGYDWQGDNILLARENLLYTFIDYYMERFKEPPKIDLQKEISEIISWNIWQMDGLKGVIPKSCQKPSNKQLSLFEDTLSVLECPACSNNKRKGHIGKKCLIKTWETNKNGSYKKPRIFINM